MAKLTPLLVCVLVVCSGARADIGPMVYSGPTLTPIDHSIIRMQSEAVDIFVGDRLADSSYARKVHVKARFDMLNESADTCRVRVGFPVVDLRSYAKEIAKLGIYKFRAVINGIDSVTPRLSQVVCDYAREFETEQPWFTWDVVFPPGPTVIDVEYDVVTSYAFRRSYQNIAYILYTGSFWKGSIGNASVVVHFPDAVAPEMLVSEYTTTGYEIDGNRLMWSYEDFEPERRDNIRVQFIPPDLYTKILEYRSRLATEPENVGSLFELARAYLELSDARGVVWNGYRDYPGMAETLLQKIVELDPSNCKAWNVYLSYYCRMHAGALGTCRGGEVEVTPRQFALIKRARECCPEDRGIELWLEWADESSWVLPDTLGWRRAGDHKNIWSLERESCAGFGFSFEAEQLDFIHFFYEEKSCDPVYRGFDAFLVRNETPVSAGARKELVNILRWLYGRRMNARIIEYNQTSGI